MIRIERTGLQLRHGVAWLQQQGLQTPQLRQALGQSLAWEQPLVTVYGKQHRTPRLTCWVADPGYSYRYSGLQQAIHPWTAELETLRQLLLDQLGVRFNSLLLNRYRDGADRMGWHADNESSLGQNPIIASVSLGTERFFDLKHRHLANQRVRIQLTHGSLLVMSGALQHHWLHQIPAQKKIAEPRLNLTFRRVFWSQ